MKIAYLYPGQGAQVTGMGEDFYQNSSIAKEMMDQAGEILGISIPKLCFEPNELLDRTDYTQIAMFTVCAAMTKEFASRGLTPDYTAGLSLGEYPAIFAAGGASFEELLETVWLRGNLMHQAVADEGYGMSAVLGLTGDQVSDTIKELAGAYVANYNCPGQIVITGEKEALSQAATLLKGAGAKRVLPLKVSGPFHSPYMKVAGEKLGEKLASINWKELKVPYVANINAEIITDIKETPALLQQQVSGAVRWEQSVRALIEAGVDTFVEIGPGKTLSKFMARIDKNVSMYAVNSYEDMEHLCETLMPHEGVAKVEKDQ